MLYCYIDLEDQADFLLSFSTLFYSVVLLFYIFLFLCSVTTSTDKPFFVFVSFDDMFVCLSMCFISLVVKVMFREV